MADKNRLWFVAPFWLCLAIDISLTLAGQSDAYWSGDYSTATEANPFAHPILVAGPWVFGLLSIAWALLLGILAVWVSHRALAWFIVLLTVAHAIGGSTWMARLGMWGWVLAIAYLLLMSEAWWWCWRRSGWLAKPKASEEIQ